MANVVKQLFMKKYFLQCITDRMEHFLFLVTYNYKPAYILIINRKLIRSFLELFSIFVYQSSRLL